MKLDPAPKTEDSLPPFQYPLFLGGYDEKLWRRWAELIFKEANARCFGGILPRYRFQFRRGMTASAGNIRSHNRLIRISIDYHEHQNLFSDFRSTVIHELIHAWQAATGRRMDHGPLFKRAARALGTEVRAKEIPAAQKARPYRYLIYCVECDEGYSLYTRKLRGGVWRYRCRRCEGRLKEYEFKRPHAVVSTSSLKRLLRVLKKRTKKGRTRQPRPLFSKK